MNRRLRRRSKPFFLQPAGRYSFVSSRLVKEVFSFGGSVEGRYPRMFQNACETYKKIEGKGNCASIAWRWPL